MMKEPKELAEQIAGALLEKKAADVLIINISPKSSFADYFVMASAGSERQLEALKESVEDALEPEGIFPKNVEGKKNSGWILMDYGDVIVNVLTAEMREKYNIEKIWADCEMAPVE